MVDLSPAESPEPFADSDSHELQSKGGIKAVVLL